MLDGERQRQKDGAKKAAIALIERLFDDDPDEAPNKILDLTPMQLTMLHSYLKTASRMTQIQIEMVSARIRSIGEKHHG